MTILSELEKISIKIASPGKIAEWSFGEVKKPEIVNYNSHKPDLDDIGTLDNFSENVISKDDK